MEIVYLLIAFFPLVSMVLSITLLATGCALRKSRKRAARYLLLTAGLCAILCLLEIAMFILVGAAGIGPVPN